MFTFEISHVFNSETHYVSYTWPFSQESYGVFLSGWNSLSVKLILIDLADWA